MNYTVDVLEKRIKGEYLFAYGSGKKGGLGEAPQLPHYAGGCSGRNPIWQGLSYGAQASRIGRACGKRARRKMSIEGVEQIETSRCKNPGYSRSSDPEKVSCRASYGLFFLPIGSTFRALPQAARLRL